MRASASKTRSDFMNIQSGVSTLSKLKPENSGAGRLAGLTLHAVQYPRPGLCQKICFARFCSDILCENYPQIAATSRFIAHQAFSFYIKKAYLSIVFGNFSATFPKILL
jgi:hypothetical protein